MISRLRVHVPEPVRRELRRLRRAWRRRWNRFGTTDLVRAFEGAGIGSGSVVFVHSSYNAFLGFTGSAPDVIAALKEAVRPEGTIVMPTLPFSGSVIDYVARGPVFDVQRTPSKVGLLTEVFRRSSDVIRSRHPTHAVAAWGRHAVALTAGHEHCGTPCGVASPYGRLVPLDASLLFLGADLGAMTFYHYVEELLESRLPFPILTPDAVTLTVQDSAARTDVRTRLYRKELAGRRNLQPLEEALRTRGSLQERRVGGVRILCTRAADVVEAVVAMVDAGVFCYHPSPPGS